MVKIRLLKDENLKKKSSNDIEANNDMTSSNTNIGIPTTSGHSTSSIKKKKKKKKKDSDSDNNKSIKSVPIMKTNKKIRISSSIKSGPTIAVAEPSNNNNSNGDDETGTAITTVSREITSISIPVPTTSKKKKLKKKKKIIQTTDYDDYDDNNNTPIAVKKVTKKERKESIDDAVVVAAAAAVENYSPSRTMASKKNLKKKEKKIKKKKKSIGEKNTERNITGDNRKGSTNEDGCSDIEASNDMADSSTSLGVPATSVHSTSSTKKKKKKKKKDSDSNIDIEDANDSKRISLALCNYDDDVTDVDGIMIDRLIRAKDGRPGTLVELKEEDIISLCTRVREQFLMEPMLLRTEIPVKICGDIHGQYYDLLRIFDHCGNPPRVNYLFLGDYCDRGKQSIEVLCLLFACKLKYPNRMHLLRGNHESQQLTRMYGFYDECKRRYSVKIWKRFCAVFDCMPIAAVLSDTIFCAHGGLSPVLKSLEQIDSILRPTDIPESGLMTDLLWSDPEPDISGWEENDRGISYVFGGDVVEEFLNEHNLDLVVRGHQVIEDGYEFFSGRKLVTIFSAPNYCGEFDNCGATMIIDADLKCHFQLLKPSTKKRPVAKALTPVQKLQRNTRRIMNAMTAFGVKAEGFNVDNLNTSKPIRTLTNMDESNQAETDVDKKSLGRSLKKSSSNITSSLVPAPDITDSSRLYFDTRALILETENLTGRQTSWGDVWDDLYYNEDELAEFRYEAHMAELESGEENE